MLQPTGVVTWMPLVGCNIPPPTHTGAIGLVELYIDPETNASEYRIVNPWPDAVNEIDPNIPPEKPKSRNIYVPVVNTKRRVIK